MSMKNLFSTLALAVVLLQFPFSCLAVEAPELERMLAQKQKVTIIDIRNHELFKAGHIQGAINISANIIENKKLPPLGLVIVCGDGFNTGQTMKAVEALNDKKGISVDFLEGGFAAWNSLDLPVAVRQGARREQLNYVSFQELNRVAADNRDLVLVDVRRKSRAKDGENSGSETAELTDLAGLFPGMEIMGPGNLSLSLFHENGDRAYVIVDNGDGAAEKLSRRLNRAGIRRNYILTGGELALRRRGRSGSRTMIYGQAVE